MKNLKNVLKVLFIASFFLVVSPSYAFAASDKPGNCEAGLQVEQCGITELIVTGIRILSGLVGVVVVAMIIVGGIQYALARDNPQAGSAAKQKIINAVLALIAYLSIFALLQWLVPGGII